MGTLVDVVIPAHNEEALLPACLWSVVTQRDILDVHIVVVANGCTDSTATVARAFAATATACGHAIVVVELEASSKTAALNAAAPLMRGGVQVFLDADTILSAGALRALVAELGEEKGPLLVAPTPLHCRPTSRVVRSWARVWRRLPSVADDVIGDGCYAVNAPGRARWSDFPEIIADDAYVRSRFGRHERVVVSDAHFLLVFPERRDLVPVLTRHRRGNSELLTLEGAPDVTATLAACIAALLRVPSAWISLPTYIAIVFATRWASGKPAPAWARAERPVKAIGPPASRPFGVHVVVVTHNSCSHITTCLESLSQALPPLQSEVTVVDNASVDGTAALVAERFPLVRLVRNRENVGYAAAANAAVNAGAEGDYLVLLNPDVRLDPAALVSLFALAHRFPQAGIYGGRARASDGSMDPSSCLNAPSMAQALSFGFGISAAPRLRFVDPDSMHGWQRDDVRAVPVLTGALLLVNRSCWARLEGFQERYVMYGEDVDFCLRARAIGYRPMFMPDATYMHVGGASTSPMARQVLILKGKVTLYQEHLSPWRGRIAIASLLLGVALRSTAEQATSSLQGRRVWTDVWRQRRSWRSGWPLRASSCEVRLASGGMAPPS